MSSEVINEVTWNINVDGIITSASGYSSNVIVPGTVDSITVVGFSNQIFKNNSTIQTISIPDSVTSLPEEFFGNSNNTTLTSVTFTENSQLTTINNYAFHTCKSLSDFKFPSTVTSLNGTNQFQETAMSSITIPAGLTSIKQGSFYNMPNLTELIFAPNSNLTSMPQGYEFTNCNKLDVIINFPAQNFPNNSNFSNNCFNNIGPNPVVILSGETTNAQADTFIGDTNMTNRFSSTPQQNGVTFYKRPLTNQNVVDLYATLSIAQLYTAGATITQLLAEGATITQLLAANVNITFAQIRAAGVNISVFVAEGVSNANMLAAGFTQKEIDIEIDIVLTQIKIHTAFTISDGTNSSVFETEFISPDNPLNTPNVFASTDAKTTTPQKWQDIQISSTGQYQIAVVGGYSLSTSHSLAAVTGNVWISTNYGETWLEKTGIDQVSGAEQSWINACVSADGSIMMVKAMGNIVYRSENGGTSWTQKTITNFTERVSTGWDGRPYYNLLMASDGEQLIIGTYNNIQTKMIISTDGGDNWADLTSLSSDYEYIIDYHMSKSGKYILVMFNNSTRPKYSDDFGATFNSITDTNLSLTTETSTTLLLYSRGVCAISDNGYAIFTDNNNQINTINLTTGTVSNNAYDGAWVTNTSSGFPWAVCISQNGQYMIVHMRQNNTYVNTMYISSDYGTTFTAADSNEFYVGYKAVTFNSSAIHSRCFATRFSDDNKYIAAIQEGDYIYVRKNTFIQGIYTPRTFAAKLTTDLGYTVTAGGDATTTDSTPYYRLYLQFANAVTLTGMPKDIFNIPFSDFSVRAGGQVNLRNVNLDADMTINTNHVEKLHFGLMTGDIDYTGQTAISGDGNRIATSIGSGEPSYTGSLTANASGSGFGQINIYERDTNAASGWTQLGETIWGGAPNENYGQNVSMSHDGEIVVAGSQRNSIDYSGDLYGDIKHVIEANRGYIQAWKRDASSTVNPVGWVKYGNAIIGKVHQDKGFWVKISGDGNSIVARPRDRVNYVEVYKYSTPGQTGGTWDLQGNTFDGNTTSGHDDYYLSMNLSYDGNILAIGNSTYNSNNGRVQVYQRDTNAATGWTQLGTDIVGTGGEEFGGSRIDGATNLIIADNGNKIAVMSENYSNAQGNVVGRVSIYKRDTNVALGWSLIGNPIENPISTEKNFNSMDISEDGNRVVIGISDYDDGDITNAGRSYVYDYNSTTLAWEHIITNSQTSSTDPITGTSINDNLSAIVISADGSKQAVRRNGKIYTYQSPETTHHSNTSTISAGNHYINQFVSTIETDLVNFTLSYDETNNRIEFVGLAQDISMNITSNDTTIFDTSITEITTTDKTLPFITYGQPDPILKNYNDNGITPSEFLSNGYTIPQLLSGSVVPEWNYDTNANHFHQSYLKGFTDVSGSVVIRNNNRLITNGDLSLGGNLTIHNYPPPYTVIHTPTNNLLTSQYLIDAGHIFSGSYGAIPTTDIDTTTKADSLTTITVTSVDMFGDMGNFNVPSNARICKYVDGGGNEIVGEWIAGRWDGSSYTRMAKIRFTLVGNTVFVKWVERGFVSTDQTDSDINLLSAWNTGTINTDYRHVITNLVFTTTYTETITYPPNGTTSLLNVDMTLKSRLFMGEDISANGNVNIGGDLSVNGQFSGDFANGIIPLSAISGDGNTNIAGHVYFTDDVSFNGPTVDVGPEPPQPLYNYTIPDSICTTVVAYYTNVTYYVIPENFVVIPNVTASSLNDITVVSANMTGANISGSITTAIYKFQNSDGVIQDGKWIFGSQDSEFSKFVVLEFSLNGTELSVKQLYRAYKTGTYTGSTTDLHDAFHSVSTFTDLNYAITGLTINIIFSSSLQVNQIEFNDGTTMTTHDDNILSGTFAGSNVVFKDSTFAQVTCLGAANVSGTYLTSDYRIKENVTGLNETDTVDSLIPIQYNNSLSGNHEFGLLAHELQAIYPYLVNGEKNGDEYQRVNYNGLIGVLVKEIQDLKQRLAVLNNR
jgi:hypothetical protein